MKQFYKQSRARSFGCFCLLTFCYVALSFNHGFSQLSIKVAKGIEKMTMGEEGILSSLAMPILVGPSLVNLEKQDPHAAQLLKTAFTNAEADNPGLCHNFVLGLVKKADLKVNLNESLLRVQGSTSDQESSDFRINRSEESFQVKFLLVKYHSSFSTNMINFF